MPRLRSATLIVTTSAAALLSSALLATSPASAASPGPAANVSSHLRPGSPQAPSVTGTNHALNSDSCPTVSFCMAVGDYDLQGHVPGLSEVLSAGKWVVKHVPSPSLGVNIFANEVSCASASSCLFAGAHWVGTKGADGNLAEAWNGSSWRIVTSGRPAHTTFSSLNDVACPTASFCLVIGDAGTSASKYHNVAYTWMHSSTWRQTPVPDPAGARNSELSALACSDAAHCMAAGDYTSAAGHYLPFAARWTSGHWKILAIASIPGQLQIIPQGVSCPTASECVVAGNTVDNTKAHYFHAFAELWKNGRWHLSTLRTAPSVFNGTSCPSASRCFASGYTYPAVPGYAHQLIETWNGSSWATQHPAQTAGLGGDLAHVSCATASSCETAGYAFTPSASSSDEAITEVWDGHRWRGQVTPNP
jgi:hypothetical protein